MTENKRFWSEDYSVGYYTEIVDNDKELADVPNPKKNLTIEEVVDLLNELNDENQRITSLLQSERRELIEQNNNYRKLLNELNDENKEFQVQCNLLREQANEFHRIARENVNRAGQLEKENKEHKEKQLQDANVYAPSKKSYRLIG